MVENAQANIDVAIAGGSIAGLCAGVVLNASGYDVQIFERSQTRLSSRGAGIVVQPDLLGLLSSVNAKPLATTSCKIRRTVNARTGEASAASMPQSFTSWEAIYHSLRSAFPDERYHLGRTIDLVSNDKNGVQLKAGDLSLSAQLFVAADGFRSTFRKELAPDTLQRYAGYIAWRGVVDEAELPSSLVDHFDDTFYFCNTETGGHALCYFIPGNDLKTDRGGRRLNWVWYVNVEEGADLDLLMTDQEGTKHDASVPTGIISDAARAMLRSGLDTLTPKIAALVEATTEPFIQSILDVAPPGMVYGRTCLIGDAAYVVRPHTAAAASKAAADAMALARALRGADGDLDNRLSAWERQQTAVGRELVNYGVMLGERSRNEGAR